VAENSGMLEARNDRPRGADYAVLQDADLIGAMRREEHHAFVEFIERFRIVAWNQARDLGVPTAERKSWTEEVLHDCALALVREGARIPGNLAGYVVVSVRRKFFKQYHKSRDERRVSDEMTQELSSITSAGSGEGSQRLPDPVMRLVDEIVGTLTEEEELLLIWKGHRITYSTIAEWLGESRSAVAQRIWRLTRRLMGVTEHVLASFSTEDRETIRRFLGGEEENQSE
jgi:DNA-directed RNA polymerase specialized sigma24 family protein